MVANRGNKFRLLLRSWYHIINGYGVYEKLKMKVVMDMGVDRDLESL